MLKLYNSLTKKVEEFKPINPPQVGMYSCGTTAYYYAHIGHGRKYLNDDILRRTLEFNGYKVKHVQNVTDVGHLTSDADEGEDKLEKGAKRSGKTVWEVSQFFTDHFYQSMDKLNILRPHVIAKATDHIPEQITLVQKLLEKGYAYDTPEAVYYDVSKFAPYQNLFSQNLQDKQVAVRPEVKTGEHKKNPADFALWFKCVGRFEHHTMRWESPWGVGFPGWHIECSAMSMKYLGDQFDIHTGGEDHLSVHHPNEIAQSEGATGKSPFASYWFHTIFLLVDSQKMSKSLDNFYTVEDVEKKSRADGKIGFDPIALRYLSLTTHYRKQLNFTWESLESSAKALENLREIVGELRSPHDTSRTDLSEDKMDKVDELRNSFQEAINNDLNTPQALAVAWEAVKSNIPTPDKLDLILLFDEVLGLNLKDTHASKKEAPKNILELTKKRDELRQSGKFEEADEIRKEIEKLGFTVQDTPQGSRVR